MRLSYLGEASVSNGDTHNIHYCFDLIEINKMVLDLKALDGIKHAQSYDDWIPQRSKTYM